MNWVTVIQAIFDVGIVTLLFYKIFLSVRGTKVFSILKGVGVIILVWLLSGVLGLDVVKFITSQLLVYGLLGVIIIFQPELRQALEKLGKNNLVYKSSSTSESTSTDMVESLVESTHYLSERNIGALINIEMDDSLDEYIKTGIKIDALVSKELLENIFTPNVPLHDGALIIKEGRIASASCYLPLSENQTIPKELGTRHRAAIGLSEVTDALTIIVSEETGAISLTKNSKLFRGISPEELRNHLEMFLIVPEKEKSSSLLRGLWNEK